MNINLIRALWTAILCSLIAGCAANVPPIFNDGCDVPSRGPGIRTCAVPDFNQASGDVSPAAGSSVVLLVDTSPGMASALGSGAVLKGVIRGSTKMLPADRLAVIGFDAVPTTVVPLGLAREQGARLEKVPSMPTEQSANPAPALEAALALLTSSTQSRRHVIFISDGATTALSPRLESLLDRAAKSGVRVSSLATRVDGDFGTLRDIARCGHGTFVAADFGDLENEIVLLLSGIGR